MAQALMVYGPGRVASPDKVFIPAQPQAIAEAGGAASRVIKWTGAGAPLNYVPLEGHATRICTLSVPAPSLYVLQADSRIAVFDSAGFREESPNLTPTGTLGYGPLTDIVAIGARVYTAGMGRQVYRREDGGVWSRQDDGALRPFGAIELTGFLSLHGLKEDDIFAVGYAGEIWRRVERVWHRLESPTNVVLSRVLCLDDGHAYACGQQGTLLRGRGDVWEVLCPDSTNEDLWGLACFMGRVYVASTKRLYVLTDGEELEPVDFGVEGPVSCMHLHAAHGQLWSFGEADVLRTEDGVSWTRELL